MLDVNNDNIIEMDLMTNTRLCLDFGYSTLRYAKTDMDYRNSLVAIHNGLELLMKLYLKNKDKNLIYNNIDHYVLLHGRNDLIREVEPKKLKLHTLNFFECIKVLSYFEIIPKEVINLNEIRNGCTHYEYTIYKHHIKKVLLVYIYPFVKRLIFVQGFGLTDFFDEKCIESIEKLYQHFHDAIMSKFVEKIELAQKHYYLELNENERKEKKKHQNYEVVSPNKIIPCPACVNDSLLSLYIRTEFENHYSYNIARISIVLKELSCFHCGLFIDDRDLLLIKFPNEEKSLPDKIVFHGVYPDDCADCDCPDDCADCDCPDDCAGYDCPDDCAGYDCPDDCAGYDCPDDCADCDCPDDCADCADCPEY